MGRNLTAAQAAERLGVSVRTLDRMAGTLDPIVRTEGGHRRYDEDQVERVRQGLPATD